LTDLGAETVFLDEPHKIGGEQLTAYLRTSQFAANQPPDGADIVIDDRLDRDWQAQVVVRVTPLGGGGPDSDLDLPESVLQARSGSMAGHGHAWLPPLRVGGRLGEWTSGAYAALGAITAWHRRSPGESEVVDVSMLEAMQLTLLAAPTLSATFPGGKHHKRGLIMLPSVHPCADGWVGLSTFSPQQWLALLSVVGRDDLAKDVELFMPIARERRRDEIVGLIEAFTSVRSVDDVVAAFVAVRVPAVAVGDPRTLLDLEQAQARGLFVQQPDAAFVRPLAPFRFSEYAERPLTPTSKFSEWSKVAAPPTSARPLAGLRVLDFTQFWAGPYATAWLAAMGAEVIKIENPNRPDALRMSGFVSPKDSRFLEAGPLFHLTNLGKKSVLIDLATEAGRAKAAHLIKSCDVVAENFTPRVMDQFGFDWEAVHRLNPSAIYLRVPAFGLSGPLRDQPGCATTMEQLTGLASLTGFADAEPVVPGGIIDPLTGIHGALAVVAALERQSGTLVEVAMLDVAAAVTAEYTTGTSVCVPSGGTGTFVCQDGKWISLDETRDPLDPVERREWCRVRVSRDAVQELMAAGTPAAVVVPSYAALHDPQLTARRFFTPLTHSLLGQHDFPGFPMTMSRGPRWWWSAPAPLFGEHSSEYNH
jgi:crotonobetainyl-CoA:carnitine CoA-transferase CaiB-like acyl-CoA transferase